MERYIIRFRGPSAPDDQVHALRKRVKVLDTSLKQMLIEIDAAKVKQLTADFPEWSLTKEIIYKIPERPIRVRKPPK